MKLAISSNTIRLIIISFSLCILADAINLWNFKWVYPAAIQDQLDGGPIEWYGFPFPYAIDAQYTSMAVNSMPHVWLLNMLLCTAIVAWLLRQFTPQFLYSGIQSWLITGLAMGIIIFYVAIASVRLFGTDHNAANLHFKWNINPYEQVSVWNLRPHFGAFHHHTPQIQSYEEPMDATKVAPHQPSK